MDPGEPEPACIQGVCGTAPTGGLAYQGASTGVPYDGVSPLYGTTPDGGADAAGTVCEMDPNGGQWTEKVLYSFCSQGGNKCTDGRTPNGVTMDAAGNIFGSTFEGGNDFEGVGAGVAYELSSQGGAWTEITLYHFCSPQNCTDGALPPGPLGLVSPGRLFGTTAAGGGSCKPDAGGCGVVFKIVPNGVDSQEAVLHMFCAKKDCNDGRAPFAGPFLDSAGNLFGTTIYGGRNGSDANGGGVAFEIADGTFKVLHSFCALANCADGEHPAANLIMNASGKVLGTASVAGAFGNG